MQSLILDRRQFLKRSVGVGALVAIPASLLTACSSQDVAKVVEAFAELPNLINDYRKDQGLDEVPISGSMTAVALKHVMDLAAYQPEKTCNDNLHSWSSNGPWKGGCYDPNDQTTYSIMWDKPKEIVNYPDLGYEISYWASGTATPGNALASWKASKPHNDVILNQGIWQNRTWNALGAVALENYACAWFGEVKE